MFLILEIGALYWMLLGAASFIHVHGHDISFGIHEWDFEDMSDMALIGALHVFVWPLMLSGIFADQEN